MQISELVSFFFILVATIFTIVLVIKTNSSKLLLVGMIFLCITGLTTILEDFFYRDILNCIEHLSWLIGSIIFCISMIKQKKECKNGNSNN
jgi:hypothetical protein